MWLTFKSFSACHGDWWFFNGKCYFFNKYHLSYDESQMKCKEMNAKLFEPRDLGTIQEVMKFAKNFTETWNAPDNKLIFFWTGLGDLIKERKFQFASDKFEMKWTNWSHGDSRENCVHIHTTGEWNDANCKAISESICERPGKMVSGKAYFTYRVPILVLLIEV